MIHRDGDLVTLRVPKAETARVTARLLAEQEVLDLNVEDPPIEDVIELVFAREAERMSDRCRRFAMRPAGCARSSTSTVTTMRT